MHDLDQHANDPIGAGEAALAGTVHVERLCGADTTDLGTSQSVWAVRLDMESRATP
ncbi:hypothetical protein [Halorhodospira halochloris]|uniref:hypothetical protein n=1 Tax=Halorhodospira halochloris TaxID=1052 RepID=UPI001EE9965A|nr:hypothetical protein [Halorhodospira halochloris]MCG5549290.1 hypothetical protein [Halorhodospira halochloris]